MSQKRTRKTFGIILIIVSICSLSFVPWKIVGTWLKPLPDTVQQEVNNTIKLGYDGMIVYINQTGKPPQFLASGWHNRDTKTPANPHALFKLASISKLYVAVAVTKLVNDGRLSLDKSIVDYLPELKGRIANADKITLRLLVQHRSGIPNYSDTPNYWSNPPNTEEETLALIYDMPANFPPNEDYQYCNTNYLLISRIMDKPWGQREFSILDPDHNLITFGQAI